MADRVGVATKPAPGREDEHARVEELLLDLREHLGKTQAWAALEDAALTATIQAGLRTREERGR